MRYPVAVIFTLLITGCATNKTVPAPSDVTEQLTGVDKSILIEPGDQKIAEALHSNNRLLADKFSAYCSDKLKQTSGQQPSSSSHPDTKPAPQSGFLEKLSSMGISIGRNSGPTPDGTYALFQKNQDDGYALIKIKPSYIVPNDLENQEVLFVSPTLDYIAPAYETSHFDASHNEFMCVEKRSNDNHATPEAYGPCTSSLTKSDVGAGVGRNVLGSVALLAAGFMWTNFSTYVDTDKERVAELVVNSNLLQCIESVNLSELKASVAKELAASRKSEDIKDFSSSPNADLGGGDCSKGGTKVSAETYYRRGKEFMASNEYKSALVCFIRAQDEEKDTQIYRDSCSEIATMYELGWGVEKNLDESRMWLRKAGM
jgi:hypothetical protein